MNDLFKKELELISLPIKEYVEKKLMEGFKNRKGHEVIKVKRVNLIDLSVDNENSSIKESILIKSITCFAEVEVRFHEHGTQNDTLNINIPKEIKITYDFTSKTYQIKNEEEFSNCR